MRNFKRVVKIFSFLFLLLKCSPLTGQTTNTVLYVGSNTVITGTENLHTAGHIIFAHRDVLPIEIIANNNLLSKKKPLTPKNQQQSPSKIQISKSHKSNHVVSDFFVKNEDITGIIPLNELKNNKKELYHILLLLYIFPVNNYKIIYNYFETTNLSLIKLIGFINSFGPHSPPFC